MRFTYLFDPTKAADIATTAVTRLKDAGVTTVIISTDPLIPKNITEEATAQNYFPEWVIGPSVLADTTIFGRTFDQEQWEHAFGLGLTAARAERELTDSYLVYDWYYGEPPAVNTQAVLMPSPERLLLGIHLAGPDLTPENFERGMFRSPRYDTGLTYATGLVGRGGVAGHRPQLQRRRHHDLVGPRPPPARTRPATRAPARSCTSTAGTGTCPASGPRIRSRWFDADGAVAIYDDATRRTAGVPRVAGVAGRRLAARWWFPSCRHRGGRGTTSRHT